MIEFELTEEQQSLLEDIQKGQALRQLKSCAGWDILTDTLEALRSQSIDALIAIPPGNVEQIKADHAIAYAVTQTINNLRNAVDEAILRGEKYAPERMQEIAQILKSPKNEFLY